MKINRIILIYLNHLSESNTKYQFQSPWKYIVFAIITSFVIKIPMFFQFELIYNNDVPKYWTAPMMDDPSYVLFTSFWDELFTTGILPLALTTYFNIRIYAKVKEFINIITYDYSDVLCE